MEPEINLAILVRPYGDRDNWSVYNEGMMIKHPKGAPMMTADDHLRHAMYELNKARDLLAPDELTILTRIRDEVCDLRIQLDPTLKNTLR